MTKKKSLRKDIKYLQKKLAKTERHIKLKFAMEYVDRYGVAVHACEEIIRLREIEKYLNHRVREEMDANIQHYHEHIECKSCPECGANLPTHEEIIDAAKSLKGSWK